MKDYQVRSTWTHGHIKPISEKNRPTNLWDTPDPEVMHPLHLDQVRGGALITGVWQDTSNHPGICHWSTGSRLLLLSPEHQLSLIFLPVRPTGLSYSVSLESTVPWPSSAIDITPWLGCYINILCNHLRWLSLHLHQFSAFVFCKSVRALGATLTFLIWSFIVVKCDMWSENLRLE
jgi:hypothetical protein